MRMNLNQTKFAGLTMQLDLKTKEYKRLCDKLDKLKASNIDENDERLIVLKDLFELNNKQIVEINSQLKELENSTETENISKEEKYNLEDIFKKKKEDEIINTNQANINLVPKKENIFIRFLNLLKKWFK